MEHVFIEIHSQLLDPDRIPVAMAAWLLAGIVGMITGPMHGHAYSFVWLVFDKTFGRIGGRLDNRDRAAADLFFRGFVFTMMMVVASFGIGLFAEDAAVRAAYYDLTEILLLALVVTGGTVWFALLQLYFAMRDKKVSKGAYLTIARSTRTDFSGTDDYAMTRTGMALAARSFDKGLVAPLLWYLLFGLPGAYLYAGLSFCAWRFGRDGFTKGFGRTALALEKLMGIVPHMLAGFIMALAGLFTPTGGMTRAFTGQLFGRNKAAYDEGGLPLTAMAYSLDVSLGGPSTDLDGSAIRRGWTGPDGATARLEQSHLRRAIYISLMAHLLFMASLMGSLLWAGWLF